MKKFSERLSLSNKLPLNYFFHTKAKMQDTKACILYLSLARIQEAVIL